MVVEFTESELLKANIYFRTLRRVGLPAVDQNGLISLFAKPYSSLINKWFSLLDSHNRTTIPSYSAFETKIYF